jgi:hypothetical protein
MSDDSIKTSMPLINIGLQALSVQKLYKAKLNKAIELRVEPPLNSRHVKRRSTNTDTSNKACMNALALGLIGHNALVLEITNTPISLQHRALLYTFFEIARCVNEIQTSTH